MRYIQDISSYTHEVKQSKFLVHLLPFRLYKSTLEDLRAKHPKARHFVTAFRHLNDYDQIVEHSSDDGEPKGTSGNPSLMVLQGQELINIAVIIVRYFGGTKLGTGGLARAYSDAVNLVLQNAEFFEYKKEMSKIIEIEYAQLRLVEYECEVLGIDIVEKNFDIKIVFKIVADERSMQQFLERADRKVVIL